MGKTKTSAPKILIVDDYEDIRLNMRLGLEQRGYRVVEATDGSAAIEAAGRERPDVILMDLTLPVIDGLAATRSIREDARMKEVVIIAVTAHLEKQFRSNALAAGCNAYVTKPVDFDWLNDLIGKLLP